MVTRRLPSGLSRTPCTGRSDWWTQVIAPDWSMARSQPRCAGPSLARLSPRTLNNSVPRSRRALLQRAMRIGGRSLIRAPSDNRPPDRQKLLPPLVADGVPVEALEAGERGRDGLAGRRDRGRRIAVCASDRLGDDLVD